tara:strand:+ start:9077 stop:10147 length:1071 start_codon:yes stop_codon:yes gene_type:complete
MKKSFKLFLTISLAIVTMVACNDDDNGGGSSSGSPTEIELNIPSDFPSMDIPVDNPMTLEGVALGRKLFYDPILSGDNSQSCASCHNQSYAFTDHGNALSTGINGNEGVRNAMALVNLGWGDFFFWDGRKGSLEDQALEPVTNEIEMHETWPNAIEKLVNDAEYVALFKAAFGEVTIDSLLAAKAIAQFERTLISGNSRFDKKQRGELSFTAQERLGESVFFTEKGDCFHCHGTVLFTDLIFHNNGLQETIEDPGLGGYTGDASDMGLMRTPTLRNIALTAPYMHDGRLNTLEEVVEFYNSGVHQNSPNVDVLMQKANRVDGQLNLTQDEQEALLAFLHTLTDSTFITEDAFSAPE